jgi:hypothetical protein
MCLVCPDDNPNEHIVVVKIDNDDTVSELKDMIKLKYAPRLDKVTASDLVLWKCSISNDDHLKETLTAIRFDVGDPSVQRLVPVTSLLLEHFAADLSPRTIHILVEVPAGAQVFFHVTDNPIDVVQKPWVPKMQEKRRRGIRSRLCTKVRVFSFFCHP